MPFAAGDDERLSWSVVPCLQQYTDKVEKVMHKRDLVELELGPHVLEHCKLKRFPDVESTAKKVVEDIERRKAEKEAEVGPDKINSFHLDPLLLH